MRWSGILTGYSTFFLSVDKKDRFTEFGKSSHGKQFVLRWDNSPPFARNPHTSILYITQKTIKNEQTTAKPFLTIRERPPCRRSPCRSFQRKKT